MGIPVSVRLDEDVRHELEARAQACGIGLAMLLRALATKAASEAREAHIRRASAEIGARHQAAAVVRRMPLRKAPPPGDAGAAAICAVIRRIPKGWVATYGQIAAMAGLPGRSRLVGQVLRHLDPGTEIPWHRVVNAKGAVSFALSRNGNDALQQRLLEQEGVAFDDTNRFDLERYRWLD